MFNKLGNQFKNLLAKINLKKNKTLLIVLFLLILALLAFLFKSLFVAALVNNIPVSRLSIIKQLEKQSGKQVLESMVDKALIDKEAKRLGIKIGNDIVQADLKKIEDSLKSQGVDLNTALSQRGQTKESLIEQIKIQKIVEAILGKNITITDVEIKSYFDSNKDLFDKGVKFEDVKDKIKEQIFQQKLLTEYQKWIADLRNKAKIYYFVNF